MKEHNVDETIVPILGIEGGSSNLQRLYQNLAEC